MSEQIKRFQNRLVKQEQPIICRIPDEIRGKHGSAYEPKIIAIGPYHRNNGGQINPGLRPMEDLKLQYLIDLCKRSVNNDGRIEDALKAYTTAVQKQEVNVRRRYSESSFEMSSEDFVRMIVLDGCFIVEFLLKRGEGMVGTMPMAFELRTMPCLRRDLLLFENQIPFFILEEILSITNHITNYSILDLALHYLYKKRITKEMLPEKEATKIHHLLHLSHLCLVGQLNKPKVNRRTAGTLSGHLVNNFIKLMLKSKLCLLSIAGFLFNLLTIWQWSCWRRSKISPPIMEEKSQRRKVRTIPTATRMKEAGICFKKKETDRGFLDISFKDGVFPVMEIPSVNIQENTSSEYRNFLALEQTCKDYGNTFTSYVVLMDNLIDTVDDVALLKNNKIIESKLGCEEDVANFFNEIRAGLCFDFDQHYLGDTFELIDHCCNQTYKKWRAKLMHDYLKTPWTIISLMGAFVLLALTTVQTAYSIKSFQNGN